MIRDDDFQRSTIALQVSSNLIKIEKADPSHIVGLNTAISLARTENYDRQLLDALYACSIPHQVQESLSKSMFRL